MKKAKRPAQGLTYEGGRPREEDSLTRKPLQLWDRIKWLLLLGILWLVLVWSVMADDPLVGFVDAVRIEVTSASWVFVLAGLVLDSLGRSRREMKRMLYLAVSPTATGESAGRYMTEGARGVA